MPSKPNDPVDPFWSPAPEPPPDLQSPVHWHVRDNNYWTIDKDVLRSIATMTQSQAQNLLAVLHDQAENDPIAAFRDRPLLTALRHHLASPGSD